MDYDELYPGRFLKAVEFKGKDVTLTITEVAIERMRDKKIKAIVTFAKTDRELVLNRTNGECLLGMFGRRTEDWIGKRVTFYPEVVMAFGKRQPAIRVRGSPDIEQDLHIRLRIGTETFEAIMKRTGSVKLANPAKPAAAKPLAPAKPITAPVTNHGPPPEDEPAQAPTGKRATATPAKAARRVVIEEVDETTGEVTEAEDESLPFDEPDEASGL